MDWTPFLIFLITYPPPQLFGWAYKNCGEVSKINIKGGGGLVKIVDSPLPPKKCYSKNSVTSKVKMRIRFVILQESLVNRWFA